MSTQEKPGFACTTTQQPRTPQISTPSIRIQWLWDISLAPEWCFFMMTRPGDKSGISILNALFHWKAGRT